MGLEWNRWLEGLIHFKESQGLLWLFFIILFAVLWQKKALFRSRLLIAAGTLGILVLFPISAWILLKGFTPFYDWLDLQQLLPLPLLLALFGMLCIDMLRKASLADGVNHKAEAVRLMAGVLGVVLLFCVATNFHGFDAGKEADEHGVPIESAGAFDALYQLVGEKPVVIAAKADVITYVRLYEPGWIPLYGRDLWSGKAAGYINSGYEEEYIYYTLLSKAELKGEDVGRFIGLVENGTADCILVPYYWTEAYSDIAGYRLMALTDQYNVIIKEDLVAE